MNNGNNHAASSGDLLRADHLHGGKKNPVAVPQPLKTILGIFALFALCFLVYWPLRNAGYIWDDGIWLTNNNVVQHWSGLWDIWFVPKASDQYYPLTSTFFLLEFKTWGLNPRCYHITNIFLQAINSILLWRILRKLGLKSAWLVAAIFAIHPVQVETVGWVVEQKNLISGALYFGAALAWLRFSTFDSAQSSTGPSVSQRSWRFYLLATVLFLLAVLAKSFVCTLPAALLIIAWWKTGRIALRDVLPLVPWFVAALAIAPLTNSMEKTNGLEFHFTIAQHMIIMGKDLWFYVLKFIWPYPLLEIYRRWDMANISALDWLFLITALAVPLVLWFLRKKIGRGPVAVVAFYMVTLFPALGFLAFYGSIMTFVTDHYFYLPIIGLIILVVEPIIRFLNRITAPKTAQASEPTAKSHNQPLSIGLTACFSLALLIPLGAVSYAQSTLYAPSVGIWLNVLKYNSGLWIAQEQAGAYYYDVGDDANASVYLQKAFAATRGKESSVDVNLGDLYSDQFNHDPSTAARYYSLALDVDPYQPGVIVKLVHCYEAMENFPQASFDLQKGLAEYPQSAALHFEFGYLLALADEYALAADQFRQVIKFEPENTFGTYNLALLFERLNKIRDAQENYRLTLQISPNFSLGHYDYGRFLLAQNRPAEALVELQKAIQISQQEKSTVLEAKSLTVLAQAYDALKSSHEAAQTRAQIKQLGFPVITAPMPISPLLPNG